MDKAFLIGVLLKGGQAVLECLGGLALFLVNNLSLKRWISLLTQHEMSAHPRSAVIRYALEQAQTLSLSTQQFYAAYLLVHGLIKLAIVFALLKEKLWAYPAAMAVLGLFVCFQFFHVAHTGSLVLAALSLGDIAIIAVIFLHYRRLRSARAVTVA